MQTGFFNLASDNGAKKSKAVKAPPRFDCEACGIYKTAIRSPKMDPYGEGKLGILIVGEGPGEVEDMKGKPWQGPVGQLLQSSARRMGIDLFRDCWNVNSVNCRPTAPARGNALKN